MLHTKWGSQYQQIPGLWFDSVIPHTCQKHLLLQFITILQTILNEEDNDNAMKLVIISQDLLQRWNSYVSGMFPRKCDPIPWSAASLKRHITKKLSTIDDPWFMIHNPWSMEEIHIREMHSWWNLVVLMAGDRFFPNINPRYTILILRAHNKIAKLCYW